MIEIQNLRFAYPGQPPLLAIDHWQIAQGDSVFLQGASGSGKSTLLSLLTGVLQPEADVFNILDTDFLACSAAELDQFRVDHFGVIFQTFNLLPYLSAVENVKVPLRFSKRRQSRVQADESPESLLLSLGLSEQQLHAKASTLSIGQQQRVAAARAMIGSPEILIADEPTSALDEDNRQRFIEHILSEAARRNTTVIMVSHDLRIAEQFERKHLIEEFRA